MADLNTGGDNLPLAESPSSSSALRRAFSTLRLCITYCLPILMLLAVFAPNPALAQDAVSLSISAIESAYALGGGGYLVTAFLSVVNEEGIPLARLSGQDFLLRQDGEVVQDFQVDRSMGDISLVLAIDTSGSMASDGRINAVRQAVASLVHGLEEGDQVALMSFDESPQVQMDFTSDRAAVQNFVGLLKPIRGSGTCLWDAAYEGIELASSASPGRRAVLLLTDGIDELPVGGACSTRTLEDVTTLASDPAVQVPVYPLGIGSRVNEQGLNRLAELTGGRSSLAQGAGDVGDRIGLMEQDLRGGYTIRYLTDGPTGAHNLFVEVEVGGARDHATRRFALAELPAEIMIEGLEAGQVVSDEVRLSIEVDGEVPAARAEIYLDGGLLGEDTDPPFEASMGADDLQAGSHSLRVVAFNVDENVIADAEIDWTYEPVEPVEGVSIAFENLQPGETVEGPRTVRVLVDSEEVVSRVVFQLDGVPFGEAPDSPFEMGLETEGLEPGQHLITAVAVGAEDQQLARSSVQITYVPAIRFKHILGALVAVAAVGAVGLALLRRRRRGPGETSEAQKTPALGDGETSAALIIESCEDVGLVGQRFEISGEVSLLGRSSTCDIVISVQPVSREHALIVLSGNSRRGDLTVEEIAFGEGGGNWRSAGPPFVIYDGPPYTSGVSTYGTYVDNERVTLETGRALRDGCTIRLGRLPGEGRVKPVILRFQDLRVSGSIAGAYLTEDSLFAAEDERQAVPKATSNDEILDAKAGKGRPVGEGKGHASQGEDSLGYETEDFELPPLASDEPEEMDAGDQIQG